MPNSTPPDRGLHLTAYVQAAAAIGAAVLGLTAYVYVLGGVVMWLRLTAARLPQDEVTAAFQDRQLLATGMKALVFEAVLLLLLSLVVWTAWKVGRHIDSYLKKREKKRRRKEGKKGKKKRMGEGSAWDASRGRGETLEEDVFVIILRSLATAVVTLVWLTNRVGVSRGAQILFFATVLSLSILVGAVTLFRTSPGWLRRQKQKRWVQIALQALRWIVTLGLFAFAVFATAAPLGLTLLVLLILLQFSERLVHLGSVEHMKELVIPVLILAAALNVVIVPYLATPPVTFDRAMVLTANQKPQIGAFIGRTSDGVYLATCLRKEETTSTGARVRVIPADKIERVVLGGPTYSFDYGKRPSLFVLAQHIVNQEPIGGNDALQLDLRERRSVCGVKTASTDRDRRG